MALIEEYWARQKKPSRPPPKKGRKSLTQTDEAESTVSVKKRGRGRPRMGKPVGSDAGNEDEDDTRTHKKIRKSNGLGSAARRRAPPSPDVEDEEEGERDDLDEQSIRPVNIKRYRDLPSWESLVEVIHTVERSIEGELTVYFQMCLIS